MADVLGEERHRQRWYDEDEDPTANVRAIIAAAVRRSDDLRTKEAEHVREIIKLRSEYDGLLREAESDRIDAIRAVDVGAVAAAAAVQLTQQNTLSATVSSSAEAMRNQMSQQAVTVATTLDAKIAPLQTAIGDLQRFQFESGGAKQQVVEARGEASDLKPVLDAIANLTAAQSVAAGSTARVQESRAKGGNVALWIGLGLAALAGSVTFMLGVAGIVLTLTLR